MKDLLPVLKVLKKNKIGAILVAMQIAITLCVLLNAWVMISERSEQMERPSGLAENQLITLASSGFAADFNEQMRTLEDLRMLKAMSGVENATAINALPLSGGGWSMGLALEPGEDPTPEPVGTAIYMVDENGLDTLGVKLIAGRNFSENEVQWRTMSSGNWGDLTIITKAMAEELFPDDWESAIGQTTYIAGSQPLKVIGIIDTLQAPWNGWNGVERSILLPLRPNFGYVRYIVKASPESKIQLIPEIEEALAMADRGRLIRNVRSFDEIRERSYRMHNGMNTILTSVVVALMAITALGLVGLTTYNLNKRKKQIGTRRALGATKWDVIRYFLTESFVVATIGVVLGGILAVVLNMVLVEAFSVNPMDWFYVPVGMLILWVLGFASVIGPARTAANLSPALATRTA